MTTEPEPEVNMLPDDKKARSDAFWKLDFQKFHKKPLAIRGIARNSSRVNSTRVSVMVANTISRSRLAEITAGRAGVRSVHWAPRAWFTSPADTLNLDGSHPNSSGVGGSNYTS